MEELEVNHDYVDVFQEGPTREGPTSKRFFSYYTLYQDKRFLLISYAATLWAGR